MGSRSSLLRSKKGNFKIASFFLSNQFGTILPLCQQVIIEMQYDFPSYCTLASERYLWDILKMYQISLQYIELRNECLVFKNLYAWAQLITYLMFAYLWYVNLTYFEYQQECQHQKYCLERNQESTSDKLDQRMMINVFTCIAPNPICLI